MSKVRLNFRKVVATAICLAVSSMMFSSCCQSAKGTKVNLSSEAIQGEIDLSLLDEGVVINGVRWATRNVDKPGTFATNPENAGMLFQWNRRVGWSATDPMINSDGGTDWDSTEPERTELKKSNDPSPVGWRIPTEEEFYKLLDTEKVTNEWTTLNGVNGRKYTDIATGKSIFLPVTSIRLPNGSLYYGDDTDGAFGWYWSSTLCSPDMGGYHKSVILHFYSDRTGRGGTYRSGGLPIRCVVE